MKKLQIVLEVEVDENAIKEIETTDGEHFTKDEYIDGIAVKEISGDSGAVEIYHEDEEYYNMNIGTCRVMNRPKIVNITEL